jgi:PAS domain S-box-containing protein
MGQDVDRDTGIVIDSDRPMPFDVQYCALLDTISEGVLIAQIDTMAIRYANPAAGRMLGYSQAELARLTMADLHTKEAWPVIRAQLGAAMEMAGRGLPLSSADIPCLRKDGVVIVASFTGTVLTMNGHPMVAGLFRDVTERNRAEAERLRLATAIEQADETVVITDAQGNITYVNPTFEAVTGYSRAEVMGVNPRVLKSGVQNDDFYRTLWATINGGKTWRGRLVNRKKDGSIYTEDATISPVRAPSGEITSYVAVKRDISPTLALEAQLLHAQKMEAVGQLAGGVAHDFNNILSVILSYAEMMCDDLAPDGPLHGDAQEIKRAARRATDLTRQLLAFSRRQVLEAKVLNLNHVLSGMEKMLTRLLGADVALTILTAGYLWNVKVDPGQIEQILMNLAVNSRDAMPRGGRLTIETANVELDADYAEAHHGVEPGAYVEIAVSDTGTGMDPETKSRIFEPFFTTKERGKGTGLGLATVFGIVRQSKGHIWVYSEPGQGTTFKIYFPRFGGPVATLSTRPEPPSSRGNETVLLVEDDEQVRVLARNILRRNGYTVLEASNGGEALLICEQHTARIHLLLTDVVLPKMSGRQLAERLGPMLPHTKVLFMSGYTDDAVLLHGVLDSDVAFLQKPLTPASLARKVREVLDSEKE